MKPLQCPVLSPNTVALVNALSARFLPATLPIDTAIGKDVSVTVSLTSDGCVPADISWVYTKYVHINGLWCLELSNLDLLALQTDLDDWLLADADNTFASLPEELVSTVLERLFLPALDRFGVYIHTPVLYAGRPPKKNSFLEHIVLAVSVEGEVTSFLRLSWQDTPTLSYVLDCFAEQSMRSVPIILEQLRTSLVSASLCIGAMHLRIPEIVSLQPLDVLLPEEMFPLEPVLVVSGGLEVSCVWQGPKLVLRERCTQTKREEKRMEDDQKKLFSEEEIREIDLPVTFELPGVRLKLENVAELVSGHTFDLGHTVEEMPVTVCVGGKAFARGRLVDVGGKAGVQLTAVFRPSKDGA